MRRLAPVVLVVAVLAGLAWAAQISVENVIQLKQLGFTDSEVKAEIARGGGTYNLTAGDLEKLKKAGVGEDLLKFMQGPSNEPLTVDAIAAMAAEGRPTVEILRAIAKSNASLTLTPAQALDLSRRGIPSAVMMAIKGKSLGSEDLKRLTGDGLSEEGFTILASIVGFDEQRPGAGQALELLQAGVPNAIVALFREGKKPESTDRRVDGRGEYQHVGKQFILRFPADWNVVRSLDQGMVTYAVTPERGATQADDLNVCFEVGLLFLSGGIAERGQDVAATLRNILPLLRYDEPGVAPRGEIQKVRLGALDAATIRFEGELKDKTGPFVMDVCLASQDEIHFMAVCRAPKESFATHEPTFDRIRQESDFGLVQRSARSRTLDASDLLDRYKASVVSVLSHFDNALGSGTGFIIHPDGYVATNAHVVLDDDGRPAPRYTVQWDQSVPRKELEAQLLGWQLGEQRMFMHWRADVALLKLPAGQYPATPLTPIDEVRLGDPVVAVGFPQRFHFDTLNIFITGGVVTRFNRSREGHIDSIFTDAKIAKGNSGGPCFSRVTGGVIGQNTYGMPIQTDQENVKLNELVGYSGVIPVRYLMDRFPLVAELGLPADPELDFLDSYALARFLLNRHPGDDARRVATRAVNLRSDSADARFLLGSCLLSTEGLEAATKAFDQAVAVDPDHMETLLTLCQVHMATGDVVQASRCAERAATAHPKTWRTHFAKGELFLTLGRHDEALRSANTAKSLVHGVLPEPCILAGQILYAKGDLDAGRREFEEATRIHPSNLVARLGVGEYFERKENYMSALLEYGKLEQEFAGNPLVMERMGRSYKQLKRWDKATEYYVRALSRSKELGATPAEETYFELGYIVWNVQRNRNSAIPIYAEYLAYHGGSSRAHEAHVQLADIYRDWGQAQVGVAYGHLSRASTLSPDTAAIREAMDKLARHSMSIDDISFMLNNVGYHPAVVADIVQVSKLNFRVDLENEQHIAMLQERKIPVIVVQAIVISNRRLGTDQAAPDPPAAKPGQQKPAGPAKPAQVPDAPPAQAGPPQVLAALAGTWTGAINVNIANMKLKLVLTFNATGQYTLVTHYNDGTVFTSPGTYVATGASIRFVDENGTSWETTYQLAGEKLVIQEIIPHPRPITFTKQNE